MNAEQWSEKMVKLLAEMPKGYWLFVEGRQLHLMKKGNDGKHVMKGQYGGVDPDYIVESWEVDIDGGGW